MPRRRSGYRRWVRWGQRSRWTGRAQHVQSGQVSLDGREEQPRVFASDLGEVGVLEQVIGEVEEMMLKTQEVLLVVDRGVGG